MFGLSKFFDSAAGVQLRRWEAKQLDLLLKGLQGNAALQVGLPYGPVLRSASHSFKVCSMSKSECSGLDTGDSVLWQSFQNFPFRDETFDLIVLVHVLERSRNYRQTIDETLRVLAPQGRVIFLGLNPWGPWWLRKSHHLCEEIYQPISVDQIKKQIAGCAIIDRGRFGVYSPSLSEDPNRLVSWSWCEKAGDRWWPTLSNGYMLSAIKNVSSARLVGRFSNASLLKQQWVGTATVRNVSACDKLP